MALLEKGFYKTEDTAAVAPFVKGHKKSKAIKARRRLNKMARRSRRINHKVQQRG